MPAIKKLTVAIVTYKRLELLNQCLKSFLLQENNPQKILLIDNDVQKSAYQIYKKFKNKISIVYLNEPLKNISRARNLALENCNTEYLAFIDDDCVLSSGWSNFTESAINSNKNFAFFQGSSKPKKTNNPLNPIQDKIYQNWIHKNLKKCYLNPQAIDTKNLILNIKTINKLKIRFDPNLPIFEDIDFGLQIKKHDLKGKFVNQILIYHQEISNLQKLIKKNFYRGKIKYVLNQKWGNFDNFSPKFFLAPKILETILNQSFNLGFLIAKYQKYKSNQNTIFIVNHFDKAANEERALTISNFLKQNYFQIETLDSQLIFNQTLKNIYGFLNWPLDFIICRFLRIIVFKLKITKFKLFLFYREIIFRGKVIKKYLIKHQSKIVILQYPEDLTSAINQKKFKVILDLPTIPSEEIRFKFPNSKIAIKKIEKLEKKAFQENSKVCFHWYSFLNLAKKINKQPKDSFILNWGCYPQKKTAKFNNKAKIIYLGNLNSPWINPQLLESIQKKSPIPLNTYSYEKPNLKIYSSLKTKGFLKNLQKINSYQFGLLTFTNDQLRNNGFSAKHLMYLSFGLPVLCPEWRQDPLLKPATIYYNEKNFNKQIKKINQKKIWLKKHKAAISLSKKLNWQQTLKPLLKIIYELQNEIT